MRGKWPSIVAVLALAAAAAAQPTALTYQGRLKSGGEPASGLHDFRFRLFDAAQGGNQLGDTQCLNNVTVADGLFTSVIDFGQQFASPDGRFLEVQIREDTGQGCGNQAGFVTLTPRQPLTAAPLASHARSAFALDAVDGGPTSALIVDGEGRVGIGADTPHATLELLSNQDGPRPGEGIRILGTTPDQSSASYITFLNGSGTEIGYVGDGSSGDNNLFLGTYLGDAALITPAGRVLTATAGGNVGIGTISPLSKLDVRGDIRFGPDGKGVQAAGGVEDLRLLRGSIDGNGTKDAGKGFSSVRLFEGAYKITFDTPFSAVPSVTATAINPNLDDMRTPQISQVTTSTFFIEMAYPGEMNYTDSDFSFCVIGPR